MQGDTNNDDTGDVNLGEVPIKLLDSSGGVVATTETDASGNYVFYDVPAGTYGVMETNIASFALDVSDSDSGDLNMIAVTITAGFNSTGNDFVDEPSRTISGTVLEDTNNDNVGDTPQAGVTLTVFDESGLPVATVFTDSNGNFSVDVPPGTYTIVQTNGCLLYTSPSPRDS